jgi:HPt (histidine-containing phosphotransfer) domain-containing protein
VPVYIIAITAHAMEGDREHCLNAGMNDYLTKPLHIAHLETALARAIRRRPAVEVAAPPLDPGAIAGLKDLREPGQPDPLAELAELFNRESESCMQRLEQGLAQRDATLASRAAHSLKGSSSNLGAHALAKLCAAMEQAAKRGDWDPIPATFAEARTELGRVRQALQEEIQKS